MNTYEIVFKLEHYDDLAVVRARTPHGSHTFVVELVEGDRDGDPVLVLKPDPKASAARMPWDEYFLAFARTASLRADCSRRKVGVVIVDQDNRVLSTGYNGSEPGGPSCLAGECPRGQLTYDQHPGITASYDNCIATHAEANAIIFARASCKGATIYLTDPPCPSCQKLIASAGIERIVHP